AGSCFSARNRSGARSRLERAARARRRGKEEGHRRLLVARFCAHEGRLRGALAFGDAVQAALQITADPWGRIGPVAAGLATGTLTPCKISVTSPKTNRDFLRLALSSAVAVPPKRLPPLNSLRAFVAAARHL